jgi:uncharacterized protein YecE (DUF72 family)
MSPLKITANFVYLRLHGPTQFKYHGSYTNAELRKWANQCMKWAAEKKDVYVYFDNDHEANAVFNALTMEQYVEKKKTNLLKYSA